MTERIHREQRERPTLTASTFVAIVDSLVNDFDVIDVLTQLTSRCIELLDVAAAGILLGDENGHLRVVGASSERIQLLELFQLQYDQGPCLDCYIAGETVAAPDLSTSTPWPMFAAECVTAGYLSVYAIPLHRNGLTLGCLNLFMSKAGPLAIGDIALAQALADVASIAIAQCDADQRTGDRDSHLLHALDSRITIEQAKGMIAEHFTVDVHEAFEMLRAHARLSNHSLTGTANRLVAGTVTVDAFHRLEPARPVMPALTVRTRVDDGRRLVEIAGELDFAATAGCFDACVNGVGNDVEVDISAVEFMDCSGYGALVAARVALEQVGGSLTITHPANQPARLLALLAEEPEARPQAGPS
jgi:anti-anti-sigma factor